jgi:hypothetical protein
MAFLIKANVLTARNSPFNVALRAQLARATPQADIAHRRTKRIRHETAPGIVGLPCAE